MRGDGGTPRCQVESAGYGLYGRAPPVDSDPAGLYNDVASLSVSHLARAISWGHSSESDVSPLLHVQL
jgi:hypothetical protein